MRMSYLRTRVWLGWVRSLCLWSSEGSDPRLCRHIAQSIRAFLCHLMNFHAIVRWHPEMMMLGFIGTRSQTQQSPPANTRPGNTYPQTLPAICVFWVEFFVSVQQDDPAGPWALASQDNSYMTSLPLMRYPQDARCHAPSF
jgi:hypothetical protein